MIRNSVFGAALIAMTLGSAACNTVQGVGRDIESVGRKGEEVISYAPTVEAQAVRDTQAVR